MNEVQEVDMTKTDEQKTLDWIDEEIEEIKQNLLYQEDRLPALKLEPKKIFEIEIKVENRFQKWNGTDSKGNPLTKALIPVVHEGEDKIWWLNVKNPIYREIIEGIKNGKTKFKVIQTGTQAETRYELIQ